jgi:hypothetical protein
MDPTTGGRKNKGDNLLKAATARNSHHACMLLLPGATEPALIGIVKERLYHHSDLMTRTLENHSGGKKPDECS